MKAIKDILQLNIEEDIKNVINLEESSEDEIQSEIESYIITDGLGAHLSRFIAEYTSNIKETGVWLSGFYGSGKSYFGKMLGYLIANPIINGTSAQERFIPRLTGVKNQGLIESDIRKLDNIDSEVIFLDIAKQTTNNGLAFTLFVNFLRHLGFNKDIYGYMEYGLYIDGEYEVFKEKVRETSDVAWDEIKKSSRKTPKAMRRAFEAMDFRAQEFDDTKKLYSENIKNFDASKLREELLEYLKMQRDCKLVFIFDETSEAISQQKFDLLELEGVAESLSSLGGRAWGIAIAQEKLDEVIKRSSLDKAQLNKVTDRFKTKIHLESTEVDVIIRNRLLLKKEAAKQQLLAYYKKKEGEISEATNLNSSFPTKTKHAEDFATYYPFHQYQFNLLQKFLFQSNALTATQVAARGMIITTFDILRRALPDKELYRFTTAYELCREAQKAPPADLNNQYDNARLILAEREDLNIEGDKLLRGIHFLNESQLVSATLGNITKTYIDDIGAYYEYQPKVEQALEELIKTNIVLRSNNRYKITSDLETKLLEDMYSFRVELFQKKRDLIGHIKKISAFKEVSVFKEDTVSYNFHIQTNQGDELISSKDKHLRIEAYSLYNIDQKREDFIETVKQKTQAEQDLISLVPNNDTFDKIDKLLEEVLRYKTIIENSLGDNDEEKQRVIKEFEAIKAEKERELDRLVAAAYLESKAIYLFDGYALNADNFKSQLKELQRKLVKNVFTKKLPRQLPESLGLQVIKEQDGKKLHRYFSADEFAFFDKAGNFTGDHLAIIEEVGAQIQRHYVDGRSLEATLSAAPWGYSYGSISTALAVLIRAGRLVLKYNDSEHFSYADKPVQEIFKSSTKFKSARFKALTESLSAADKEAVVNGLLDLQFEEHTGEKIDWKHSDFAVVDATRTLANHFISAIKTLRKAQPDFRKFFKRVFEEEKVLQNYTSKITEANYMDKARYFLKHQAAYEQAIKWVVKSENFIRKNLDKVKRYERFVDAVQEELKKAGTNNEAIQENSEAFKQAIQADVIEQFKTLMQRAQAVKDAYYNIMIANAAKMTEGYAQLQAKVEAALHELRDNYPPKLNQENIQKLEKLKGYCEKRQLENPSLEFHISFKESNYSLSDILNHIALLPQKESDLMLIEAGFLKEAPPSPQEEPLAEGQAPTAKTKPQPKLLKLTLPDKVISAAKYRQLLTAQLRALSGLEDDAEVEVIIKQL